MIKEERDEDAQINAALAEIEALPIELNRSTAEAIAILSIVHRKSVSQMIVEAVDGFALKFYATFWAAKEIRERERERESSRGEAVRQRSVERKAMTPSLRLAVLQRDKHRCVSCGAAAPSVKLHVDHKLAIANGGKTEIGNLQALCEECNLAKSAKVIEIPFRQTPEQACNDESPGSRR
jgi:5-methylcytosine-specific restriction enzyme A